MCAGVLDAVAVAAVVALVVEVAAAVALTVRISCASIRSRHSATWSSRAQASRGVLDLAFFSQMSPPLFKRISTVVANPLRAAICSAVSPKFYKKIFIKNTISENFLIIIYSERN